MSLARGCLVFMGVFVVSAVGLFLVLSRGPMTLRLFEPSEIDGAALMVALVAAFFLALAASYVMSIPLALSDIRLLQEAMDGRQAPEGERSAFVGSIESDHTLSAPVSGEQVLAYSYSISQWRSSSLGSGDTVDYYRGSALVPSRIVTPAGSLRLLTFPALTVPVHPAGLPQKVRNFQAYASGVTFEPPLRVGTPEPRRNHESKESHRYDQHRYEGEIDWQKARLKEYSVRRGERVVVYGRRSGDGINAESLYLEDGVRPELQSYLRKVVTGAIVFVVLALGLVAGYLVYIGRANGTDTAGTRTQSGISCSQGRFEALQQG
jgi:hypothetical protein